MFAIKSNLRDVARFVIAPAAQLRNDLRTLVVLPEIPVNQSVHPEVFIINDFHMDLAVIRHIFRPYAQDDLLSFIVREQIRFLIRQFDLSLGSDQISLLDLYIVKIHRRQTNKAGYKDVRRGVIKFQRCADLLDMSH